MLRAGVVDDSTATRSMGELNILPFAPGSFAKPTMASLIDEGSNFNLPNVETIDDVICAVTCQSCFFESC